MKLVGTTSRKEVLVTLGVWGVLLALAVTGLLLLKSNAISIIDKIHYVNVGRGDKAAVLYAEADKNARAVLKKALGSSAGEEGLPSSDPTLKRTLALFDQAVEVDPRPEFDPERSTSYQLLAQVQAAAKQEVESFLSSARALLSVGDEKGARDFIYKATVVAPSSPEPLVLLAQAELKAENAAGARDALQKAFAMPPVSAKAHWVMGLMLRRDGSQQEAAKELQKAIAEAPHNLDLRRDLADTLFSMKDLAGATKVLQDGLEDGGWLDAAYVHLYGGYLLQNNDFSEAIRVLSQADKLAPYSGDVQFDLARAYHKAGKSGQASSALRRATEAKPELQNRILE